MKKLLSIDPRCRCIRAAIWLSSVIAVLFNIQAQMAQADSAGSSVAVDLSSESILLDFEALVRVANEATEHEAGGFVCEGVRADGEGCVALYPNRLVENSTSGVRCVSGRLDDGGSFVLAVGPMGGIGAIWTVNGVYELRATNLETEDGMTRFDFFTVDESLPECSAGFAPAMVGETNPAVEASGSPRGGDPAGEVRVLVVFDVASAMDAGDTAAFAVAAIETANLAYANSNVAPLQLTLAGVEIIDGTTTESDVLILRQITNRYDAIEDKIHTLRDAYDADLVARLIDRPGFCGRAWVTPNDDKYGFSLIDVDCAIGNLTFAHELGHNFGCNHDPDNASSAFTNYGFGHRWNADQWRSVMSYSPGTRVPHFSNPNVLFDGGATGIADQRDNARTLNLTAGLVGQMRLGDGSSDDCDGNGLKDRVDIARNEQADENKDGVLDVCEIMSDPTLDCDNNGKLDSEQLMPRVFASFGPDGPIGTQKPVFFFHAAMPPPATDVTVKIGARGDLASSSEYLVVDFNNSQIVINAFVSGADCYSPGLQSVSTFSAAEFAPILASGMLVTINGSASVDPAYCDDSLVTMSIEYRTENTNVDADDNGILDVCEGPALGDVNLDGEVDLDDIPPFAHALVDRSGFLIENGLTELELMSVADVNQDSVFDSSDIRGFVAILLSN